MTHEMTLSLTSGAMLLMLGAFHGINPGMGWLFAVALGMQEQRRGAVYRALLPLASVTAVWGVTFVVVLVNAAVVEIAARAGIDAKALSAALEDPALKERAKREVETAISSGVFGSPFFVVDGEAFWGCDRMPMVEQWVKSGGW